MGQTQSAAALAARIQEQRADLVRLLSQEQGLVSGYYQLRAESSEADAAGDIRRATALLNQSVIAAGQLTAVRREIAAGQCRLHRMQAQAADEADAAHDTALFLARIAAGHAGMDDASDYAVRAA